MLKKTNHFISYVSFNKQVNFHNVMYNLLQVNRNPVLSVIHLIFVFNNYKMFHSVSTYLVSLDCKLIVSHRCHASFGWLLQIFSSLKFWKKSHWLHSRIDSLYLQCTVFPYIWMCLCAPTFLWHRILRTIQWFSLYFTMKNLMIKWNLGQFLQHVSLSW